MARPTQFPLLMAAAWIYFQYKRKVKNKIFAEFVDHSNERVGSLSFSIY